ncbi:T9SS type A sorting domain-containing protein [Flavobacteriales bacterium]|nr:T9SS type A sorting domain-containing protein [Flavobacteriales bacterium]
MKKFILTIASFYILTMVLNAFSAGAPAGNSGAPNDNTCAASCHNTSNVGDVTFTTDIPSEGYTPGETYNINVTGSTATSQKYGFQLAVRGGLDMADVIGTLISDGGVTTQFSSSSNKDYLTHNGALIGAEGSWDFQWTAPNTGTGTATFYVAMIAANGADGAGGDEGLSGSLVVEEHIMTSIETNVGSELAVYPQLVKELFFIENAKGKTYQIYSMNGQLISSGMLNSEREELSLNAESGAYIVKVEGESKKIIKL